MKPSYTQVQNKQNYILSFVRGRVEICASSAAIYSLVAVCSSAFYMRSPICIYVSLFCSGASGQRYRPIIYLPDTPYVM